MSEIATFQKAHGLAPDGIIGPETQAVIDAHVRVLGMAGVISLPANHSQAVVEPATENPASAELIQGFDAAQSVLTNGALGKFTDAVKGKGFVIRYLSYSKGKDWTAQEADAVHAALGPNSRFTVWEANGDQPTSFNAGHGEAHALAAMQGAADIGQPESSGIYFAVDFDAERENYDSEIKPYFQAINTVVAGKFRIGAYADPLTYRLLLADGLIDPHMKWAPCAVGWGAGRGAADWNIKQGLPADPWGFGFKVDPDVAHDLVAAGGW